MWTPWSGSPAASFPTRSAIGSCTDVNGDTPTNTFVPRYSLGNRWVVSSRSIVRANPIQSPTGFTMPSRCASAATSRYACVSVQHTRSSGKRSNTPPAMSIHSDRFEKKAFSAIIAIIAANPAGP